jgi:hypothetical protein
MLEKSASAGRIVRLENIFPANPSRYFRTPIDRRPRRRLPGFDSDAGAASSSLRLRLRARAHVVTGGGHGPTVAGTGGAGPDHRGRAGAAGAGRGHRDGLDGPSPSQPASERRAGACGLAS